MSADSWMCVAVIAFALASVTFVVAVILFFRLNIVGIYAVVSGKALNRGVEKIWQGERERNSKGADIDFFHNQQTSADTDATAMLNAVDAAADCGVADCADADCAATELLVDNHGRLVTNKQNRS